MAEIIQFVSASERERVRRVRQAHEIYDSIFPVEDPVGDQQSRAPEDHATGGAKDYGNDEVSRDQDHRRPLQSLISGGLPRADRNHVRLRQRVDAVLPDGRAAACRLDEAASGRAARSMALRDRQIQWQGSVA
jgi:hypothetical protein